MEHRGSSKPIVGIILVFIAGVSLLNAGFSVGLDCGGVQCTHLVCSASKIPACVSGACGCAAIDGAKKEESSEDLPWPKVPGCPNSIDVGC